MPDTGIEVLAQRAGGVDRVVARMRQDRHTVLVGTRSLAKGVDIPGAALSVDGAAAAMLRA